ncbi:hypothetical protein BsWGS_05223 [Bradybaena similaris]
MLSKNGKQAVGFRCMKMCASQSRMSLPWNTLHILPTCHWLIFFLFFRLKSALRWQRFTDSEDIITNATIQLRGVKEWVPLMFLTAVCTVAKVCTYRRELF